MKMNDTRIYQSMAVWYERVGSVAAWLHERAAAGGDDAALVVLVVHGDFLDELLQLLLGSPARFMHYNTAQSMLSYEGGRWTSYFVNRAEHAPGEMRSDEEMIQVVA